MSAKSDVRIQIEKMCVDLATNPLLVQGAGGNVSWKEDDTLWIKASGTWLSDAADDDIFIPTNLVHLRAALTQGNFDVTPIVTSESNLRPSIETLLHALMPQRVVVHLHAIDVLCHLVRDDCVSHFQSVLPSDLIYTVVKYCKPGEELAKNVAKNIKNNVNINIVFLLNHGLVLGGDSVGQVVELLDTLVESLEQKVVSHDFAYSAMNGGDVVLKLEKHGYIPVELLNFHSLATNSSLSYLVENKWTMFPDHVVFLGEKALIGRSSEVIKSLEISHSSKPPFIFCTDIGTFQSISATKAQIDQLSCFYDVAVRQSDTSKVVTLSKEDVNKLLDWDAEKYRLSIAK